MNTMSNYRLVIIALGAGLILTILAIAGLAVAGIPAPQTLDLIAAGCMTGLTGLLARPTAGEHAEGNTPE
jgi:hypothetical protein